jgi:hypothetical protein
LTVVNSSYINSYIVPSREEGLVEGLKGLKGLNKDDIFGNSEVCDSEVCDSEVCDSEVNRMSNSSNGT